MKRSLILILSLFMLISSINGANFNFNQNQVISDYSIADLGYSLERVVVGNDESYSIGNQTGDYKIEIRGMTNDVYILIDNAYINTSLNVTYVNDNQIDITSNASNIAITQELTLNEQGLYYLKFEPTFDGESIDILLSFNDAGIGTVFVQGQEPKGFNSAMTGFINAFTSIIAINTALWQLMFYVVVFTLSLGFLFLLFGLAFTIFAYAKKLRQDKMQRVPRDRDN